VVVPNYRKPYPPEFRARRSGCRCSGVTAMRRVDGRDHQVQRVQVDQDEPAAGPQRRGCRAGPAGQVADPAQDAVGGHHDVERPAQLCRQVEDIGLHEPRIHAGPGGQAARARSRRSRGPRRWRGRPSWPTTRCRARCGTAGAAGRALPRRRRGPAPARAGSRPQPPRRPRRRGRPGRAHRRERPSGPIARHRARVHPSRRVPLPRDAALLVLHPVSCSYSGHGAGPPWPAWPGRRSCPGPAPRATAGARLIPAVRRSSGSSCSRWKIVSVDNWRTCGFRAAE